MRLMTCSSPQVKYWKQVNLWFVKPEESCIEPAKIREHRSRFARASAPAGAAPLGDGAVYARECCVR